MSAAPALRKLLSEIDELFQASARSLAEHLNQSVRRLRQAGGFPEIAGILCDASAPFCGACAVFEIAGAQATGISLRGADPEAAARFRQLHFPIAEAAAFAGILETCEPLVALCSPAELSPALIAFFAPAPDDKAHLFPLTAGPATVGLLYACGPVESAALELLAQCAAAVLDARRRPAPAPAPDLISIAPAAASDWDSLTAADRNLHLQAQRFARVQVAEMRLYREDAVKAGRRAHDLYAALADEIDRTREEFRKKFMDVSTTMVDYFHRELVRTLANDDPASLGEKYPGPLH